jgi:hypothetical protein
MLSTSWFVGCRFTTIARHSRVYSSSTVKSRNDRPACVRSCTKSYVQTWLRCSGRSRMHDFFASSTIRSRNAGSSSATRGVYRCVDRGCSNTRQARLWAMGRPSATAPLTHQERPAAGGGAQSRRRRQPAGDQARVGCRAERRAGAAGRTGARGAVAARLLTGAGMGVRVETAGDDAPAGGRRDAACRVPPPSRGRGIHAAAESPARDRSPAPRTAAAASHGTQ